MRPVAIFRHTRTEGPGYFATFLDRHSIPWKLVAIDAGETLPADVDAFSGICLMGGTVSVNDALPWIEEECRLIRAAVAADIPVIGHCLGGQLISMALGGSVGPNRVKELGWGSARIEDNASAARWFGDGAGSSGSATVFHWHGETFSIPAGATRILAGEDCANQMFALGPHLAMQCHVEMTPEMIATWCDGWAAETRGLDPLPPSVQTPRQMQAGIPVRLPAMRKLAARLYSVWMEGLRRD